jgi:hypothetical protein
LTELSSDKILQLEFSSEERRSEHLELVREALKIFIPSSASCLCEIALSQMAAMKTKH